MGGVVELPQGPHRLQDLPGKLGCCALLGQLMQPRAQEAAGAPPHRNGVLRFGSRCWQRQQVLLPDGLQCGALNRAAWGPWVGAWTLFSCPVR